MEQTIKRWNDLKITQGRFEFNCGGDSMGDTQMYFKSSLYEDEFEDAELANYFEDAVYKKVEFYEASDGHYMGEAGNVFITLNDDGNDFDYNKSAQSEWCNTIEGEMLCEVTEDEANFLNEYIAGMSFTGWNGNQSDYKKDFILTDEHEVLIDELHTKFADCANDFEPEAEGESDGENTSYNTSQDDGSEPQVTIIEQDGKHYVKLFVACSMYQYTDAND
jgi:hypothetical protein